MVLRGEIRRLMIFAPPQHGKSELVSVRFPAFWLAHRPDDPIILTSYGASLAEDKSRAARALIQKQAFNRLFPEVDLRSDSRSSSRWHLAGHRGGMIAAGVGGPITGRPAMLGIIDDPFENWAEAQSKAHRKHVWEWYRGTFRTRLWEDGAIILIMTRWHEDDLAGKLLSSQGGRLLDAGVGEWVVLRLPALAETDKERRQNNKHLGLPENVPDPLGRRPGAPLCPQRYSRQALLKLAPGGAEAVGTQVWNAEYQGVPRAPEGNLFKRTWFRLVPEIPRQGRFVRYWDKAGTQGDGDYTVGLLMCEHEGLYYVVDIIRGQWSALRRKKVMKQVAELDAMRYGHVTIWVEQEPGSGGKESAEMTVQDLAGYSIHIERSTHSKVVRSEPFRAQCEAGNVYLKRARWNGTYIDELIAFPNGTNDDQVDTSSGAFNKLALTRDQGQVYHGTV
jgi:predicted phage terminase large subunit-like protein